jgi:phage shock protein C
MKRLYRSRTDRIIAGIYGGTGDVCDIDPTLIRLVLVFLGLATGIVPLLVAYSWAPSSYRWARCPRGKDTGALHAVVALVRTGRLAPANDASAATS